ncbi:MAG: hypothetical protein QG635_1662 [Bacteroidota bacterium]|nr:hypothetical protein [Bacteroidota bacterium]
MTNYALLLYLNSFNPHSIGLRMDLYLKLHSLKKVNKRRQRKALPLLSVILSLLLILIMSSNNLTAQETSATVKGTVIDQDTKEPLVSASVSIPVLRIGAISDQKGNFTFKAPPGTYTLEIKYIGYETITKRLILKANETTSVDLKMTSQSITTNEIVVVGLSGEVDRNKIGNSIGSVSGKDVAKVVSTTAIDAITGRVTGAYVEKQSGTPGAGTYITLRGRKTISGSSQPLYIVDGIVLDNTSLWANSGEIQYSNRAVDINPQDIESIEVLKGASAAAIYGSRAGNGVILITTKRGRLSSYDKPATITFNSSYQMDVKAGDVPLQTIYGQRSPNANPNLASSDSYAMYSPANSPLDTAKWGLPMPLPAGTKTYNNSDKPFRNGFMHEQSLSITGGVPQFDYLINGTYTENQGYVENSLYERSNIRANLGLSLLPHVTIQTNNNFIVVNNDLPQDGSNISGILLGSLRTPPEFNNDDYLFPDGTQRRFTKNYDNPIWTQKNNKYNSKEERILHSTNVKWNPYTGIILDGRVGLDYYEYNNTERLAVGSRASNNQEGHIWHGRYTNKQINLDLTGTFNYNFFDDELQEALIIGGQTIWTDRSNDQAESNSTLPFFDQIGAGATKDAFSYLYSKKTVGLFAQLTSTLWNRLSLTLAMRREGSSCYGESQQFHYYPKASLSYVLSDEPFMKDMKGTVDNLRIRASYGHAGSPDLPDWYATNFLYTTAGFFDPWVNNSNATRGGFLGLRQGGGTADEYVVAGAANINPELSIEREIGIDVGLFNNMITLEATYYYTNVYDMILSVPVPASTGYDRQLKNAAEMWNKGIELALRAMPFREENFRWSTAFMYSTNDNEVTKLKINPEPTGREYVSVSGGFTGTTNIAMKGQRLGVFYGYGWLRDENGNIVYSYWDEAAQQVVGDDYEYNYVNAPRQDPNLKVIGDPNPDFMLSWKNEFTFFNNLTLSFLFDGVFGNDIWNGTQGALYNFGTHGDTKDRAELWFNENGDPVMDYSDPANPVQVNKQEKYWSYYNGFGINEPHIEDGSFIKLREVVLEYRWDGLKDWNINNLVFTFSARNLLTITKYSGYDPEVNTFSLSEGRGFDYFSLPQVRSYRLGISIIY